MSELEDIGRYHQLRDELERALHDRNNRLQRAAAIIMAASGPPVSRYNLAKRCNFDAAERLMAEAHGFHDQAMVLLEEIKQVAPAAGKPIPTLE